METILGSEVEFHPLSFGDPSGRLFSWNGGLYRGIPAERTPFYRDLLHRGLIERLVHRGLVVETDDTDLQVEGYALVLKHRRLPFVSYPYEWCGSMLKDAALLVADLEIELARHGLTLQDAHPWNVLFEGSRPVFVDLGSIIPTSDAPVWEAYDQFCRYFIHPLQLMARGHGRIARWLLHDHDQGVLKSDLNGFVTSPFVRTAVDDVARRLRASARRYVPPPVRLILKQALARVGSTLTKTVTGSRVAFLERMRQRVAALTLPMHDPEWSDYYEGCFPSFADPSGWTSKHQAVSQVLSELRPASVLDAASNRGWYAQLAARAGSETVAFDATEACISQLYADAKRDGLRLLSLVMDLRSPSPGYGLCNRWFAPATERLRCELVLALALVHHLVLQQQLNFEHVIDGLATFSTRWLLVEFIPQDDQYVRQWQSWRSAIPRWYTLGHFKEAVSRRFRIVQMYQSHPAPRALLLCERSPSSTRGEACHDVA